VRPDNSPLTLRVCRAKAASAPDRFDGSPQEYTLLEENRPCGHATLPWADLRDRITDLNVPHPAARDRRTVGDDLRDFLEHLLGKQERNWRFYDDRLLQANGEDTPTVFNLQFGAVELFALPWELTRISDGRTVGDLPGCIIQYEWDRTGDRVAKPDPPGRLLFAWAGRVPHQEHLQALSEACPGFHRDRDQLAEASLDDIHAAMVKAEQEGDPVQVLHLLCHGVEMPDGTFSLQLRTPVRGTAVDGSRVVEVLGWFKQHLQCVVLCACHGSHPGNFGSVIGGVAQDIHRLGIPIVIGSRWPLSFEGSIQLAQAFHKARYRQGATAQGAFLGARRSLGHFFHDRASLQLLMPSSSTSAPPAQVRRSSFGDAPSLPSTSHGSLAVLTEVNTAIAPGPVLDALGGCLGDAADLAVLRPLREVGEGLPATPPQWKLAFQEVDRFSKALIDHVATATPVIRTVHLFCNGPLPLMFRLGFRLARQPLRIYQQHRERGTWSLGFDHGKKARPGDPFFAERWPDHAAVHAAGNKMAVTVEVTGPIGDDLLAQWLGVGAAAVVRLAAARGPSPEAVTGPEDVARAVDELRKCLDRIHGEYQGVEEVWLALKCPASFAAALGRASNPNAQKPLVLFNYRPAEKYVEVHRPPSPRGARKR